MILTCLPNKFAGLDALLGCCCRQLQNVSCDVSMRKPRQSKQSCISSGSNTPYVMIIAIVPIFINIGLT